MRHQKVIFNKEIFSSYIARDDTRGLIKQSGSTMK